MPKEKFVELWNSSVQKMRAANLHYRKMDYDMDMRGNEVYSVPHCKDGSLCEYLALEEDYDPFD